jgi:hypothetical protein
MDSLAHPIRPFLFVLGIRIVSSTTFLPCIIQKIYVLVRNFRVIVSYESSIYQNRTVEVLSSSIRKFLLRSTKKYQFRVGPTSSFN